ncbi:hypothetical protein CRI94_03140 [Longibacter salinarum]|uniref:Glycoside hydrolase n=1 Tax=Longibacter salinarum TaxID=1850348 RepID=A0A2A8D2W5_9BACT|nr:TIM-barrel domain-containing protein [Longibacter salinarum]PEN15289.1 hypothetical protein CRI94_03140 [Longibacter salinarum]
MMLRAFIRSGISAAAVLALAMLPVTAQPVSIDPEPFRINLKLDDNTRSVIGAPPRANKSASFGLYFSGVWERVVSADAVDGKPGVYAALTERGTPLRISVETGQTVSKVTIEGPPDIERIGYGFVPSDDERFYSHATGSARLDRRGTALDSRRDSSVVPFALSSRGYGVYLPTEGDFRLDFGTSTDLFTFWAEGATVTFHFYTAPEPAEIIARFTESTGRMGLPPTAQYGVWKHRHNLDALDKIERDTRLLRAYDVASSAYVVDEAWATSSAQLTSTRDTGASTAMAVAELRDAGFNVMADVWPLVRSGTSAFEEAAARQLLVADSTGAPLMMPSPSRPQRDDSSTIDRDSARVALVDFTHPESESWWTNHVAQLARADVNGVILNEVALPDSGLYHGGEAESSLWRTWRQRYVHGTRKAFKDAGMKHPVIAGRAVDAGASRALSLVQSKGWTADFDSTTGLPAAVISAQSAGFAGVPLWTATPTTDSTTVHRSALARWIQFQAFTPSMHLDASYGVESWLADPEMASIIRRYSRLHSSLSTYLWHQYKTAKETGTPVMRPLMLEVPRSANRTDREDQYFLGPDVLVAPITDSTTARRVYLPPGEWMHLWSQDVYPGDMELDVKAPLDEIPVFVRRDRDALSSLLRPLYKRQRKGLASYLERLSLTEPAPPLSADVIQSQAPDSVDSTGEAEPDTTSTTSSSTSVSAPLDSQASVTDSVTAGSLPDVLKNAPTATAKAEVLRSFLVDLEEARLDIIYRKRQGLIAPVAAETLVERIVEIDRTTRLIISIIEA